MDRNLTAKPESNESSKGSRRSFLRTAATVIVVGLLAGGTVVLLIRHRAAPSPAIPLALHQPHFAELTDSDADHTSAVSDEDTHSPLILAPTEIAPSLHRAKPPSAAARTLDEEMKRLVADEHLTTADINIGGSQFTMQVPPGAQIMKTFKEVIVKKGMGFELLIDIGAADLVFLKERWKNDSRDRLQSLLQETEDTLISESIRKVDGKEKKSYRFLHKAALDDLDLHLRNSDSTTALQPFGRDDCLRMLSCARTIALKRTSPSPTSLAELRQCGAALERDRNGRIVGMALGTMPCSDAILAQLPLARLAPTLRKLDLTGAILSDEGLKYLAVLKNLRALVLPESTVTPIHGPGLAALSTLTQLQDLSLANTAITDDGLASLKVFPALKSLKLQATRITGTGFENLQGLTRLQVLHLEGTPFNDDGLRQLGHLTGLRQLYLEGTKVSDAGLEHLQRLTGLTVLHLDDTAVAGTGFAALNGLTEMDSLTLNRSRFSDAGLKNLAGMRKLTSLQLASTALTGEGLSALQGMIRLKSLLLRESPINDAGLAHFPSLAALQVLDLSGTQLSDTGVKCLKGLTNLRSLILHGTAIDGSGLEGLRDSTQLGSLSLSRTRLQDAALVHLRPFKKLHVLTLAGTPIGDAGLVHMKDLGKLNSLDLTDTATTDEGLEHLAELPNLRFLRVMRSKVTPKGANRLKKQLRRAYSDVAD